MWKNIFVIVVFAISSFMAIEDGCTNGTSCVFLEECPSNYSHDRHSNSGLTKLQCSSQELKICCPNEKIVKNNTEQNNLLPDWNTCGIQYVDLWMEGRTDIDEHSWIALLRYKKPNGYGFYCDGVLISSRYVLTAAHCVNSLDFPSTWKLSQVRLGEWNLTSEIDCQLDYCSPPVLDVPIEETIVHENYNTTDYNINNDIALIRLSHEVNFTASVKPICLPMSSKQVSLKNINLEVAGWDITDRMSNSIIKQKARVQVVKQVDCKNAYKIAGRKITSKQICANGHLEKDCRGYSGGILMRKAINAYNMIVVGLRSYGPSPCHYLRFPTVYTRVTKYMDWIQSKLRP